MPIAHSSRPIWAAFALTAAVCVFLSNRQPRPEPEFWDLPALADQVRKTDPDLHLIPVSKNGDLGNGFYLSERTNSWQEVSSLVCNPGRKHRWRGVALCRENKLNPSRDDVAREVGEWGEGGFLFGDIVIVGDPELIRRIRAALPCGAVVNP